MVCLRLALGGRPRLTTALPSCALVNGCSIAGSGPIRSPVLTSTDRPSTSMRILRPDFRARLTRFVSSSFRYEIFIYVYENGNS